METTARLIAEGRQAVCQANLKVELKLDKSAISRRVAGALEGGYLKNLEDRRGRAARLVLGDPLPANRDVLPTPDLLRRGNQLHGCAGDTEGRAPQPSQAAARPNARTEVSPNPSGKSGDLVKDDAQPPNSASVSRSPVCSDTEGEEGMWETEI